MSRTQKKNRGPEPWFRKQTGHWKLEIDGKQTSLSKDKDEAYRRSHEMMAKKPGNAIPRNLSSDDLFVVELLDQFLTNWC